MVFSDSHCHLDRYSPQLLADVLADARANGVNIIVSVAMNLESSANTIGIARSYDGLWAAVGIHPWNAVPLTDRLRRELHEVATQEHVVAIGEVGLDYAHNPETRETQKELLVFQLSLARESGLPVNIHCREAHQDMINTLRPEVGSGLKGIIHGFNGDQAMLQDWLATAL